LDNEKGIVTSKLYKADLIGENRVYIGQVDYDFQIFPAYIYENYLFGTVNSIKVISEEDGVIKTKSSSQIVALNLDTLEITYLSELDETPNDLRAYIYDDKLYCMFRKLSNDLEEMYEIRVFSLIAFSLVETIQAK
jgi:hypothetical protein